jgi:hypothetical protein
MNPSGKMLEIFDKNPNSAYEFSDLHELIGGDYKANYNALKYLVKCKCVVKALPGLNGGRKCTYFKRTRE